MSHGESCALKTQITPNYTARYCAYDVPYNICKHASKPFTFKYTGKSMHLECSQIAMKMLVFNCILQPCTLQQCTVQQ